MTTTFRSIEPRRFLLPGAVLAVVVAIAMFTGNAVGLRALGWFAGGPVATTLVAMSRAATNRWTARTGRVPPRWQAMASASLVVLGFALSIAHASTVALEFS